MEERKRPASFNPLLYLDITFLRSVNWGHEAPSKMIKILLCGRECVCD